MARDSVKVLQNFKEVIGGDAEFVQCGTVFFCSPSDASALDRTVQMHQRLGIRAVVMTGADLKKMEPELVHDDIGRGAYEPDGGYADPALAANSFREAAERAGVEVLRRTTVTGLEIEQGRIRGVLTDKGEISTPVVINIAGPWGDQNCRDGRRGDSDRSRPPSRGDLPAAASVAEPYAGVG